MKKFIQKYLGIKKPEITKIYEGSQNEAWDINGKYILKIFNKAAIGSEEESITRELKEYVAEVSNNSGISAILACKINGEYVLGKAPYFMVYPKSKYKSITRDEITLDHLKVMAERVAMLHSLDIHVELPYKKKEKFNLDIDKYIRKYSLNNKMNVTLRENKTRIERIMSRINNAIDAVQDKEVISHNDLKLANVLWDGLNPYFIDWDATGYVNHMCAANEYAYSWSIINGRVDMDRYNMFMKTYLEKHKCKDNIEDILYLTLYGKFSWLQYSLDRGKSEDEDEAKKGMDVVIHMLKEFEIYENSIPGMVNVYTSITNKGKAKKDKNELQIFNYHGHTYRCRHADGTITDEEWVKEYIRAGFKEIAFTDHVPQRTVIDTRKRMRMDYSEKDEYLKSINALKEKYKDKIDIKVGFEIEYLPEHLEELKELKQECDFLVIGQHYIYDRKNKEVKVFNEKVTPVYTDEEMMEYYTNIKEAVENGLTKIIVHPEMYVFARNSFGEHEEKIARKIVSLAEKYDLTLEINLMDVFKYMSGRLNRITYPSREFWKIVSKTNVKVIYGVDVHYRGQLRSYKEMVKFVRTYLGKDIVDNLNFVQDSKEIL